MKKLTLLCWGLTVIFALVAGYVNMHAKEVQAPALLVLVFAFVLGWLQPKWAWLWALAIGLSIPLSYLIAPLVGYQVPYPPQPNVSASLIALIPAFIGAYGGVIAHRMTVHPRDQQF